MRNKFFWFCLTAVFAAICGVPMLAFAGETPAPPVAEASPVTWPLLLIPVVTPLVIAGVKWLVPRIPGAWLPVMAPMVGASLDVLAHFAAGTAGSVWVGAVLGVAGVGVRELYDQLRKAGTTGTDRTDETNGTDRTNPLKKVMSFFVLGSSLLVFPGCAGVNLSPEQKENVSNFLIEVAKAGLKIGLNAIAKNNPDLARFMPALEARFQVTFANAAAAESPAAFAAAIRKDVAATITDAEVQRAVLDLLAECVREEAAREQSASATEWSTGSDAQAIFAASVADELARGI